MMPMIIALMLLGQETSPAPPPVPSPRVLEVAASLYAWELQDEGIENVLDRLQSLAAVNSVYLVSPMHPEPRPHGGERFPHNPVRTQHLPDDAAVYFLPRSKLYGRLKPARPMNRWLRDRDHLASLVRAAHKRGLKVGAEVSHAYLPEEMLRRVENSDLIQRDIHGLPVGMYWMHHAPCPNHPDVQRFITALVADLATERDLDFIQTCMLLFAPGGPAEGGCFCASCAASARARGVDWDGMVASLRKDPNAEPARSTWLEHRRRSTVDNYRRIHEAIKSANPRIEFRLNHHDRKQSDWAPETLALLRPYIDSIRLSDYAEQRPDTNSAEAKRIWIKDTRTLLGEDLPLIVGLGLRGDATGSSIRRGVVDAVKLGVNGFSLGHYDGATFASLRAVRVGFVEASVPGVTPTLGLTLSASPCRGLRQREFIGSRGVAAVHVPDRTGRAIWQTEIKFPHASGTYDLRFTVADPPAGRATISLRVGKRKVGTIILDHDNNVWNLRKIPRVALVRDETLTLTGTADGSDWAITEHVEFIPSGPRSPVRKATRPSASCIWTTQVISKSFQRRVYRRNLGSREVFSCQSPGAMS